MKTFEDLFDHKFCDHCKLYSSTLIQSEEGEWLCPECEGLHTCNECGTITDEVPMSADRLCFDCVRLTRDEFNMAPIVQLMEENITKLNNLIN